MANYNPKIRGIIEGLSDFWLLYFKDIDQLEVLYRGADILVGQSYLDLMSLLLNNSVQDAPLFNKEFFKHIFVKETEIKFQQRTPFGTSVYRYAAEDNLVYAAVLNNKVFNVTAALERGVDYDINERDRIFDFTFDPLNAYTRATFGSDDATFTLRTRRPGTTFAVELLDNGSVPTTFTLNNTNTQLSIAYDGPANGSTATARSIVTNINTHPLFSGLLVASLAYEDRGNGSPAGAPLTTLSAPAVSPLDGYATRLVDQSFGGKFTCSQVADWTAPSLGIKKGDILRLISGPAIGRPVDYSIDTVRADALYLNAAGTVSTAASGLNEFKLLREPYNNQVSGEPFSRSGVVVQSGADGVLTAATKNFYSPTAVFSPLHVGDRIEFLGSYNTGHAQIIAVTDANNVIVGVDTVVDEPGLPWQFISTATGPGFTDGVLTNNGDGTGTFTSASASFNTVIRTVLKIYRAGVIEKYEVYLRTSTTSINIYLDPAVAGGTGLTWLWANSFATPQAVSFPFAIEDSVTLSARRLLDGAPVALGRDYFVNEDTAIVTPQTVWETSVDITINYRYRLVLLYSTGVLQSGTDGALTYGVTSSFSAASAAFTHADIGQAIVIGNSAGGINAGIFYIQSITSPTTVVLTQDRRVAAITDANNGTLTWSVYRRGTLETQNVSVGVYEIAFWAPDVLVDRYHLYNTFGYLIGKVGDSSEQYRSLIRGIFQLFMLGPTLERFESAINTVAGLPVVRDDGEILLSYSTGDYANGVDGYLSGPTREFSSVTANFAADAVADYLYITTGLNAGKQFKIVQVLDPTTVILDTVPTNDGPVSWELSVEAEQSITTSRTTYAFARTIPIRPKFTNPVNWGVSTLRAFEVMTAAFNVTDYIESPAWWTRATIPPELWEGENALRRNSTAALFENVIGAADDPHIGDPGFLIGADSQGFVPPAVLKYDDAGNSDGDITGDVYYPASNNVYFTTTISSPFTAADTDNILVVSGVSYRILQVLSSSQIKIEAFTNVLNATGLAWEVYSQPVPLRHKAAFVILDTWLKYHLFSLSFDPIALGLLGSSLLSDLDALVFAAKPSYTYILVSPSSLFNEIITVTETLFTTPRVAPSGTLGEVIAANTTPLSIGSGWRIGGWFRYAERTATFSTPTATVPDLLGVPGAGYAYYPFSVVIDSTFVDDAQGVPIPYDDHVLVPVAGASGTNPVCATVGTVSTITVGSPTFTLDHSGARILITGTTTPTTTNNGRYFTIGTVLSDTQVVVGELRTAGAPYTLSDSTDGNWAVYSVGGRLGHVYTDNDGTCVFDATTGVHTFSGSDVGTYVRFIYPNYVSNQTFRIEEYVSATQVRLATSTRYLPSFYADETGSVTGVTLTASTGFFLPTMGYNQRLLADPATVNAEKYYIVFTSGANTGERRRILDVLDTFNVDVDGAALTTDAAADFYVELAQAYTVIEEMTAWEHLKSQVTLNGNALDLSNTPTQATVGSVGYTAYGVLEPEDPAAVSPVFDASLGDTYYYIGMPDPRPEPQRSRSARDVDLHEDPIQIKVT